jgi:hypothetical protein
MMQAGRSRVRDPMRLILKLETLVSVSLHPGGMSDMSNVKHQVSLRMPCSTVGLRFKYLSGVTGNRIFCKQRGPQTSHGAVRRLITVNMTDGITTNERCQFSWIVSVRDMALHSDIRTRGVCFSAVVCSEWCVEKFKSIVETLINTDGFGCVVRRNAQTFCSTEKRET